MEHTARSRNEYVLIEPLEHPLLGNLAMVGITGSALHALPYAIDEMEKRRGIKAPIATPTIKNAKANTGIDKRKVAAVFQDIKWNYDHWLKNLASPSNKLKVCRLAKGSKTESALWNPVSIGLYLLDEGILIKSLDSIFRALEDWTDEWEEKTELERVDTAAPYRNHTG